MRSELFLNVVETGNGVDHAGVRHPRPLQPVQFLVRPPHLPEIARDRLRELLLTLLRDLPQLQLVLLDLLLVEAAVLRKLPVFLSQQENLFGGRGEPRLLSAARLQLLEVAPQSVSFCENVGDLLLDGLVVVHPAGNELLLDGG